MNIVINAVQAMPDGGFLELRMERDKESVVVSVKDSGSGIAPENLERIFDPFFTTKDSGTGLGLVIASNIMRANGGYIKVASEQGKGSVFSLYFPAEKKETPCNGLAPNPGKRAEDPKRPALREIVSAV